MRSRIAEIIELLDRVRDSYNVNRLSQVAAVAALGDAAYYDWCHREGQGDARRAVARVHLQPRLVHLSVAGEFHLH